MSVQGGNHTSFKLRPLQRIIRLEKYHHNGQLWLKTIYIHIEHTNPHTKYGGTKNKQYLKKQTQKKPMNNNHKAKEENTG